MFGNGLDWQRAVDLDYRVTGIITGTVIDRGYSYDVVDNITNVVDNLDAGRSQTFDYDELNRLTDATGVYGNFGYTYDEIGNRLTSLHAAGPSSMAETYTYGSASNRLETVLRNDNGAISTQTSLYTLSGALSAETRHDGEQLTYTYNARNRLVEVSDTSGVIGSYAYNVLGERIRKSVASEETLFVYGPGGQMLAEHDGLGSAVREY